MIFFVGPVKQPPLVKPSPIVPEPVKPTKVCQITGIIANLCVCFVAINVLFQKISIPASQKGFFSKIPTAPIWKFQLRLRSVSKQWLTLSGLKGLACLGCKCYISINLFSKGCWLSLLL